MKGIAAQNLVSTSSKSATLEYCISACASGPTCSTVSQVKVFVIKSASVDALSTGTVSVGEVWGEANDCQVIIIQCRTGQFKVRLHTSTLQRSETNEDTVGYC